MARLYRTVQINAGRQVLTAVDPLPDDLRDAVATLALHTNCPKSGTTCAATAPEATPLQATTIRSETMGGQWVLRHCKPNARSSQDCCRQRETGRPDQRSQRVCRY